MRRLLPLLLGLFLLLLGAPANAQDPAEDSLKRWDASLSRFEKELADNPDLPDTREEEILLSLVAIVAEARQLRSAEQERVGPIRSQLASLGAAPAEGQPPEDPGIAATRARLSDDIAKSQGRITRAELAINRAQTLQNTIGLRQQARSQSKLIELGPSPLYPGTWITAFSEQDVIYRSLLPSFAQWWHNLQIANMEALTIGIGVAILVVAGLAAFPLRRWILRKWGPQPGIDAPSYTRRIVATVAATIARIVLPAFVVILLFALFGATLSPQSYDPAFPIFVYVSGGQLVLFFVIWGLILACLSPDLPAWRIVPVPARAAVKLGRRATTGAGLWLLSSIALTAASSPASFEPSPNFAAISAAIDGLIGTAIFIPALRSKYWVGDQHFKSRLSRMIRWTAGALIAGALLAALIGYTALSDTMLGFVIVTVTLIGLALLAREVIGEAINAFMIPGRRFYDAVSRATGMSPQRGRRLAFWLRLAADVVLWPPVIYITLIASGLSPTLLNAWLVRLFTRIQVGGVTFSLVDLAAAAITIAVGLFLVSLLKRWIRERVMPNTQLDLGMQNSIATGIGYASGLLVLMIAIMVMGIDFSSIALVAGALSVGIGFGLRTVVENFVAGVLLLIERPIKAGDWIVVGNTEGIVKSISVRSTEIETFDRASVIVPNSALIASPVINWTHKNRVARVNVKLSTAPGADARVIERILLACAKAAEHVMKHPAPSVVFRAIGEEKLEFELRCFVSDTDYYLPTLSAVNFAIDEALRRERIQALGLAGGPAPTGEQAEHADPKPAEAV